MTIDTVLDERINGRPVPEHGVDSVSIAVRPRWWRQLMLAALFYWAYALIRDVHGLSATGLGATTQARRNGLAILRWESVLNLDVERRLQQLVLPVQWLVKAADAFYGSAHFGVTLGVFGWLLLHAPPERFRYYRNVLAVGTLIALAGFAVYPTMPPRLLPPSYGYVDTLHVVGGLWSYNDGVLEHISDPYAAMPSLHLVWAIWCVAVLWRCTHRPGRVLLVLYPLVTSAVVLVTANHWVLDLVAGLAVFLVARAVVRRLTPGRPEPAPGGGVGQRGGKYSSRSRSRVLGQVGTTT